MAVSGEVRGGLAAKFQVILPHLDERQRRLLLGAEARALDHGGIRAVAQAAGVREATVSAGAEELGTGGPPVGPGPKAGGGRKRGTGLGPGPRGGLAALGEAGE